MKLIEQLVAFGSELEDARLSGARVGLVPTMGALHAGHLALVESARKQSDLVAVTIFVNPLQFGDDSDLVNYPRTLESDFAACKGAGVDVVFVPTVKEMYPSWPVAPDTSVSVRGISEQWEGLKRPGHFDGVATVLTKIFATCGRCKAYFGEKDFQQLAVVRKLVADLSFPIEVIGCPTQRDFDGVAISSRNVRLSNEERKAAVVLPTALEAGRQTLASGARSPQEVVEAMESVIDKEPLATLDYVALVDAHTLSVPLEIDLQSELRLLVAVTIGNVHLIDNSPGFDMGVLRSQVTRSLEQSLIRPKLDSFDQGARRNDGTESTDSVDGSDGTVLEELRQVHLTYEGVR